MIYRTAILSTFDAYLETGGDTAEEQADQQRERQEIVRDFPFAVMLELAFPELDFANRWCWKKFGPANGECSQRYSEYPACTIDLPHCHVGAWAEHWFVKTDYDFGFNEWYFSQPADYEAFLRFVPSIDWGENYPK
ncbi:hypothetical protein CA54_52850 [Symmachiella macrocystis]|uniref:Uncharacterized protein n=1 Tax=Symmachiella macrocystis TaxID=2527985 RepID=A0A5C6B400_9PLAN|nr:hypothetical protein [Symmachiella macrocystis]TWU06883.1 hypothetical protein CA54_52850 [Symmachiella macrocystis]